MTNKELTLANLMRAMIKYDGGDAPRIQHFVKVHDFARMIAIAEGMTGEDLFVLEAAAILHDVGIHVSEARYGNCDGKHQEELGPDEARKVLSEVDGFTAAQIERICWLIAHHHTYQDVTSLVHPLASLHLAGRRAPELLRLLRLPWAVVAVAESDEH